MGRPKYHRDVKQPNRRAELEEAAVLAYEVYSQQLGGFLDSGRSLGEILSELRDECNAGEWFPTLERLGIPERTARWAIRKFKTPSGEGNGNIAVTGQLQEEELLAFVADEGKTTAQRIVASDENEWYTPRLYIEAATQVLGGIDLDPASSEKANETVGATYYFSKEDDGLSKPWGGKVWLNPPYGRLAGDFSAKLVAEHQEGRVVAAVLLVNAHCTDTEWFKPLWDHVLCFTDHRIDFDSNGRDKDTTSTHGSVFVYLGGELKTFADTFSQFGPVVKRLA